MLERINGIPTLLIMTILIIGVLIFVLFKLIDKYYIAFSGRKKVYAGYYNYAPKIKLFIWLIWFVMSVYFLLLASPFITIIFLIGLYLFSKDLWKNIYSGIFISNKVKKGDYIYISKIDVGGIVSKLLLSDIELQKENDELVYVPYSLVINSTITKRDISGKNFLNEFYLEKGNINLSEKLIKEVLINCPWTVLSKPFDINFNHPKGIQIRAYTFSKKTAAMQQECVKRSIV